MKQYFDPVILHDSAQTIFPGCPVRYWFDEPSMHFGLIAMNDSSLPQNSMEAIEALRAAYRPKQIATLFVGESAPISGKFFYDGNNTMVRYMQRATEAVIPGTGDFLDRFKSYGWYLDDLVLTPINNMLAKDRKAQWLAARESLKVRIARYRPLAIVSLLKERQFASIVHGAAVDARSEALLCVVPFPGNGQQGRFHEAMLKLIPTLPKNG
jgi:hypothetical protein